VCFCPFSIQKENGDGSSKALSAFAEENILLIDNQHHARSIGNRWRLHSCQTKQFEVVIDDSVEKRSDVLESGDGDASEMMFRVWRLFRFDI
jgi:hypothetical protein